MSAVLYRLRVEARSRWRTWIGLALLTGVVGGVVIACLAGARRTETAYHRFLAGTRAYDVLVSNGSTPENFNRQFRLADVERLPEVADLAAFGYYLPAGTARRPIDSGDLFPVAPIDGKFGRTLNGARVLEGRLPTGELEVAVTPLAADVLGVDVGDTLRVSLSGAEGEGAPTRTFAVVGRAAMQGGLPPLTDGLPPTLLLSPAWVRAHPPMVVDFAVRLVRGRADVRAFQNDLDRLGGGAQITAAYESDQTPVVHRSHEVEATTLRLVAAVGIAVAIVLFGQAVVRHVIAEASDDATLRALGATTSDVTQFRTAWLVLTGLAAMVIAAAVAVALSPLTPTGTARLAELHPGVEVNLAHLGLGCLALVVVVVVTGVIASRRAARLGRAAEDDPRARIAPVERAVGALGLGPAAVLGVRMGLPSGRDGSSAAIRSTVASLGLGVATIAAVLCFSAGLHHLFDQPRLYGWGWDAQIGDSFAPDLRNEARALAREPNVEAIATGTIDRLEIAGRRVDTIAIQGGGGGIRPVVVAGRAPASPSEILIGSTTLRRLGLRVGDAVPVGFAGETRRFRIVGRGTLPTSGGGTGLGEGAAMTFDGMRRVVPRSVENVMFLRLRPGTDVGALVRRRPALAGVGMYVPKKPPDLVSLGRLGSMPSVAAAVLGLAAVGTLAHALLLAVRRRRRDFAVLKTLGFVRRDVAATVAWQASVVVAIALAVGLPLGVAAGRTMWDVFADRMGVQPAPVVPLAGLAIVVPVALLLANAVAAFPARAAARTGVAHVLRGD